MQKGEGINVPDFNKKVMSKPTHVYIDCTETYLFGLNTGIQKVVQNIVIRTSLLETRFGIPCIPVISVGGGYLPLPKNKGFEWYLKTERSFLKILKTLYNYLTHFFPKKRTAIISGKKSHLQKKTSIEMIVINFVYRIIFLPILFVYLNKSFRGKAIVPQKGDLILIPDSFWGNPFMIHSAETAYRSGANIIPVIHDLFLFNPDYASPLSIKQFSFNLSRMLQIASGLLTVSRTMQNEISDYLSRFGTDRAKQMPSGFFYLGCDSENKSTVLRIRETDNTDPDLLKSPSYYLMVGTLEPRKGYEVALEAFESLWQRGEKTALYVVGRVVRKYDGILQKIEGSPYLNRVLFIYQNIPDQKMEALYRNAKGLIFASLGEGFGLPMVEAMCYGIPVIASDLPVFKEIAEDYPLYFRKGDPIDLARVLEMHIYGNVRTPERPASRKWLKWDKVVENFMNEALRLYSEKAVRE